MNVAAMVEALRRKIGAHPDDGMLTPDVLTDLLDEANTMLEAERDWPWRRRTVTFDTVAGQRTYTSDEYAPAGDFLRSVQLKAAGEVPLTYRTVDDVEHYDPLGVSGLPESYAFDGDTLVLSPTPASVTTMTHRYVRDVPTLLAHDDEPLMPNVLRWAIVQQAAALAFSRVGDESRAQVAEVAVDRWRRRMLDDFRKSTPVPRVRVRAGSMI